MATIDARCKLLGQAGPSQVRVYSGVPITSRAIGQISSESSPEILISSPASVYFLSLVTACQVLMRAQQRCRKASCAAPPLFISSLCHRFLTVAVCICVSLHCHYIYIHIYFITYWGEKKKIEQKKRSFMLSQLSLPPWLCTCSFQVPFRNDEENDFITLWPSVSVPPCEAVVLNSANPEVLPALSVQLKRTPGDKVV